MTGRSDLSSIHASTLPHLSSSSWDHNIRLGPSAIGYGEPFDQPTTTFSSPVSTSHSDQTSNFNLLDFNSDFLLFDDMAILDSRFGPEFLVGDANM